jgi:L-2-hydroxyglutarate oxidase LhgO
MVGERVRDSGVASEIGVAGFRVQGLGSSPSLVEGVKESKQLTQRRQGAKSRNEKLFCFAPLARLCVFA